MIKEASNHLLKTISLKARTHTGPSTGQKDPRKTEKHSFRPFDLWFKQVQKKLAKKKHRTKFTTIKFDLISSPSDF